MRYIGIIFLILTLIQPSTSQQTHADEFSYGVYKVYPPFSITRVELNEAQTLVDLNKHYKSSWIKEFESVEISATVGRVSRIVKSKNDILTPEQKEILTGVDPGSDISIVVRYIPDNNLKHNDIKIYDCTIPVEPDHDAEFPGGIIELNKFLETNIINHLPKGSFTGYDLSTVKFTINEKGQIIDAHIFWPWEHSEVEELMLAAVCNMPVWKPAEYHDGTKLKQQFALTVGNMKSCVVNMLNIKKDGPQ